MRDVLFFSPAWNWKPNIANRYPVAISPKMLQPRTESEQRRISAERWRLLRQLSRALDGPMTMLSFVWLALLVVDLTHGLRGAALALHYIIWFLFSLQFVLEFAIAPSKTRYLRRNWLTAISLLLPALRVVRVLRVFRALRAARAVRGMSLLRFMTSLNRGMRATRQVLGRRGLGYVAALTVVVVFAGAAAMYSFERPDALRHEGIQATGLTSYSEALWWTSMIMTTMGTEYWPKTVEGRVLCLGLALYAFAIFGYITANIATYFLGESADDEHAELAALREELKRLNDQLQQLKRAKPENEPR